MFDIDEDPSARLVVSPTKSDGYIDVKTGDSVSPFQGSTIEENDHEEGEDVGPGYLLASAGGLSRDSTGSFGVSVSGGGGGGEDDEGFDLDNLPPVSRDVGSKAKLQKSSSADASNGEEELDLDALPMSPSQPFPSTTPGSTGPAGPVGSGAPTPPPAKAKPLVVKRQGTATEFLPARSSAHESHGDAGS